MKPVIPGRVRYLRQLILVLIAVTTQSCYHYRVTTSNFDPSTGYEKKTVCSLFWGLGQSDRVNNVRELILRLNETQGPFSGVLAFRYVKGTNATLGFTRFNTTCIIELDGVFSDATYSFYKHLWSHLDALNIPYTFHWGKILELDSARIRRMYGNDIDKWIVSRNELMNSGASMRTFSNDLLHQWGLDAITVAV